MHACMVGALVVRLPFKKHETPRISTRKLKEKSRYKKSQFTGDDRRSCS